MKEVIHEYMQENQNDWWMRGRIAIVLSLLNKFAKKTDTILDIGAGTGIITEKIKAAGYNNISVVDNSPTSLNILKEKNLNPIEGSLPELNIDGKCDFALLLDVLEHIEDDKKTLLSIYEHLNTGGKLLITVPAFMFLWTPKDIDLGHFRRYNKNSLLETIQSTKFKIKFMSYYNFFLFIPALIYSIKNKKKTRSARYSKTRDKYFTPIFKFERHFISRNIKFPFGVSMICILEK